MISWRLSFDLLVIPVFSNNSSEKVWDLASYPCLMLFFLVFVSVLVGGLGVELLSEKMRLN